MSLEATYHTANLLSTAFFCGSLAAIFGYACGYEKAQAEARKEVSMEVEIIENYGFDNAQPCFILEFKNLEEAVSRLSELGFFQHSEVLWWSGEKENVWAVLPEPVSA